MYVVQPDTEEFQALLKTCKPELNPPKGRVTKLGIHEVAPRGLESFL